MLEEHVVIVLSLEFILPSLEAGEAFMLVFSFLSF